MKTKICSFVSLIIFCFICASSAIAYNFLDTDESGKLVGWDNTNTIKYYLDPGPLADLTNEQAHVLLKEAMKLWESVPTANPPKFEFVGYLLEDVNKDNYHKYVDLYTCMTENYDLCENLEAHETLKTVIIFDNDNYILENEMCRIEPCLARAGPMTYEGGYISGVKYIAQGRAVFGRPEFNTAGIVAWFTHELGHLLGITHTSLNQQLLNPYDVDLFPPDFNRLLYFPTMEVSGGIDASISSEGTTLSLDDMTAVSVLYPSETFSAETAKIKGRVKKANNSPMPQVNVVARNIEDPLCKAYSFITSRFCPHPLISLSWTCLEPNGDYEIAGLPPGNYTLEVEEIVEEPYLIGVLNAYLAGDAEFWNEGDQASEDPYAYTIISLAAGETRENVDIILNRSEVTEDRVKFIPLDVLLANFPLPATTACTDTTIDYAGLIGKDEGPDDTPTSAGCSLIIPKSPR